MKHFSLELIRRIFMAANIEEVTKEMEDTGFYNLVQIGEGGFGIVYKGRWKKTATESTLVAIKTLKEQDEIDKLIKEKSIMEAIIHRNIVRFFGVYNIKIGNSMTNAIVTEFMIEGSVEDFLKRKSKYSIKPLDILSMAMDAATGMRYLHENNIIHRDLAARNLLLSFDNDEPIVKVSDFGLSRKVLVGSENEDGYYHIVTSKNPIKWSAPEYFLKKQVSIRSDLWSFGVLLYELFTLCKNEPYEEWNNSAVIKRILAGEKMYEYLEISDGPKDIQELLNSCMNNNSHARPVFDEIILNLKKIKKIVQDSNTWNNLEVDDNNNNTRGPVYNKYSQKSNEGQDVEESLDKGSHSSVFDSTIFNKENKAIHKLYYEEVQEDANVLTQTQPIIEDKKTNVHPLPILHLQELKKKEAKVSISSSESVDHEANYLPLNPDYKPKLTPVSSSNEKDYVPRNTDYDRREIDNSQNEKDYTPTDTDYIREEIDSSQYDKEAKKWLELAKKGSSVDQYKIGYCYYNGTNGVPQDYKAAVFWYEQAANKGNVEAQNSLGNCYKKGNRGVPQDIQKAIFWFNLAAEQGYAPAQFNLGFCYQEIAARCQEPQKTQNYQKAAAFYKEAAQQNHQEAPFYLGILYEKGWGVSVNHEAAMGYYIQAKSRGFGKAQERIDKLNASKTLSIKRQ